MTRHIGLSMVFLAILPSYAQAQALVGLRIEGPDQVVENTLTLYTVIAEFDTGWEFEVTLDSFLWVEPGMWADIGVFGDFDAFEVSQDEIETINAYYTFGAEEQTAAFDVTILNVPPAGYAGHFGGDDYVEVPNSTSLSISSNLTIEAWARLNNPTGGWQQLVFKGDTQSGMDPYYLRVEGGQLEFGIHNELNVLANVFADVTGYDWGAYHHLAAVFDDDADQMLLYIDGQLVATESTTVQPMTEQDGMHLRLGKEAKMLQYYQGDLDEVRVWNKARTHCEIVNHMNRPLNGTEPGLVGYWRFDEGQGQYALDSSPYGNDGVLGSDDDPAGDGSDPEWLLSFADLYQPAFDAPYWTTPEMIEEVSSGEEWNLAISDDQLEIYIGSERDGFAETEIYRATRSSVHDLFSTPAPVWELSIPGYCNHEGVADLSASGLRIYFCRHYADYPADFYVAQRDSLDAPWGTPGPIDSLNTAAHEFDLAVSADELSAVFTSSRSGENRYWVASRASVDDPWANLALIDVLDGFEPRGCGLSADGLTLYVTAEGPTGLGGEDVWRAARRSVDDSFGEPVHIPELSSEKREFDVSISSDPQTMYVVRQRTWNAGDVYESHLVVPGQPMAGDLDCDGDLDLEDFAVFAECIGGPMDTMPPSGCTGADFSAADLDDDFDVDLADFSEVQSTFTGPE